MKGKISGKKYLIKNGRKLPFYESFINVDWREKGIANILISKKQPAGNITFGVYLVDVFCLGIKNTFFNFNFSEDEYREVWNRFNSNEEMAAIDVVEAHNIIYGAIDYAEEFGFHPHKDFKVTQFLLNPDMIDDGIDDIEFGKNGKPFYIAGPNDHPERIINTLMKTAGEGNFDYMM